MWEVETKYTVGDARPNWVRGMMPCQQTKLESINTSLSIREMCQKWSVSRHCGCLRYLYFVSFQIRYCSRESVSLPYCIIGRRSPGGDNLKSYFVPKLLKPLSSHLATVSLRRTCLHTAPSKHPLPQNGHRQGPRQRPSIRDLCRQQQQQCQRRRRRDDLPRQTTASPAPRLQRDLRRVQLLRPPHAS